jgi:hypothetical protein
MIEFFKVLDQYIFDVYENDDIVASIMYLIQRQDDNNRYAYVYAIEFSFSNCEDELLALVALGLVKFQTQLTEGKARIVDLDGGDLGRGDNL